MGRTQGVVQVGDCAHDATIGGHFPDTGKECAQDHAGRARGYLVIILIVSWSTVGVIILIMIDVFRILRTCQRSLSWLFGHNTLVSVGRDRILGMMFELCYGEIRADTWDGLLSSPLVTLTTRFHVRDAPSASDQFHPHVRRFHGDGNRIMI